MSLADGQQTTDEKKSLQGADFLSSAGLVLDLNNAWWYYWKIPTHSYSFDEEWDFRSIAKKMFSNTC
ncbi:hypothetical protein NPIL_64021 [Nephila pilipes]|uniref:Uncharacterized protein n=1 Tax=Nephila pilipes TaxID=299642 RepID=A0A8X6Q3Z0_NEPPI|nr:hypothetical protein NPIL_64021 [Nephila pilipes]